MGSPNPRDLHKEPIDLLITSSFGYAVQMVFKGAGVICGFVGIIIIVKSQSGYPQVHRNISLQTSNLG